MSGKYFLQSGLRVLELLVKMDIVYEDKDKIILNKPVAGDGKYVHDMISDEELYRQYLSGDETGLEELIRK